MIATGWWLTPPLTRLSLRGAPAPRRIDFGFPGFGGYHHMVVTDFPSFFSVLTITTTAMTTISMTTTTTAPSTATTSRQQ